MPRRGKGKGAHAAATPPSPRAPVWQFAALCVAVAVLMTVTLMLHHLAQEMNSTGFKTYNAAAILAREAMANATRRTCQYHPELQWRQWRTGEGEEVATLFYAIAALPETFQTIPFRGVANYSWPQDKDFMYDRALYNIGDTTYWRHVSPQLISYTAAITWKTTVWPAITGTTCYVVPGSRKPSPVMPEVSRATAPVEILHYIDTAERYHTMYSAYVGLLFMLVVGSCVVLEIDVLWAVTQGMGVVGLGVSVAAFGWVAGFWWQPV